MHKLTLTLLAALASPLAFAQSAAFDYDSAKAPPTGTLLHYTKSNRDGSKPWHVEIYVQSPTRINVIKWVEGNTDFVEIMADIDTTLAMPIVLQQWNTAGGRREPRLSMRGLPGEGGPTLKAQLADGPSFDLKATTPAPFNFWGFDLAGLGFMLPHWSTPEQPLELWFADPNCVFRPIVTAHFGKA